VSIIMRKFEPMKKIILEEASFIFRSKVDRIFILMTLIALAFFTILFLESLRVENFAPLDLILLGATIILLLLMFIGVVFGTYSKIDDKNLVVYHFFIPKLVPIVAIKSLEVNVQTFVGLRTSFRRGVVVNYNAFDDIYITPKNEVGFVFRIKELNEFVLVKGL
jgi:hypothetical protein